MWIQAAGILAAYLFLVVEYSIKVVHLLHVVTAVVSCLILAAYFIYSVIRKLDYNHPQKNEMEKWMLAYYHSIT